MKPEHERIFLYVVVLFLAVVVGYLGWHIQKDSESGAAERSQHSLSSPSEETSKQAASFDRFVDQVGSCSSTPNFDVFMYPNCVVNAVLRSPIVRTSLVGIAVMTAFLAILVRQAIQEYLACEVFPILLLAPLLVAGTFVRPYLFVDSYFIYAFLCATGAGSLSFWATSIRSSLLILFVTGLLAGVALYWDLVPDSWRDWTIISVSLVGGFCLHCRSKKKREPSDRNAQDSGPSASLDDGGEASTSID